jgi:hypothetical protein
VVADQVGTGGRDEGDQAVQELVRLEHDLGRAVAPAMAQVVEKPAIGQAFQAIGRHGRAPASAATASRVTATSRPAGTGPRRDHSFVAGPTHSPLIRATSSSPSL